MNGSTFVRRTIWLLIIVAWVATFALGLYLGYEKRPAIDRVVGLASKEVAKPANVDFAPFWQAWNLLNEKYVVDNGNSATTTHATNQDKVWGAIEGLTASLGDPYTTFFPPEKKKKFDEDLRGNFSGVGMEIGIKDEVLTVISPLPDSPAKKAGILAGDKILKIDDKVTGGLSADEAVNLIRGPEGTVVKLTLGRGKDKPFDLSVTRAVITIPTIEAKKLPSGVFLIRLYNFSAVSSNLFRNALRQFAEAKTNKLIIDLRGNPGGFLDAAVDMASFFLPEGKPVVIEKHGTSVEDKIYRSSGYDVFTDNLKMVILVDKGSASASEILAGALSEYGKATLVGEKTFGKGSVQELVPVTKDSSLKITVAKWYTPKGHSISLNGLKPAVEVPITPDDVKAGKDPQLDKAVEILLSK